MIYKVLNEDRTSTYQNHQWPEPGVWVEAKGPLVLCQNGVHLCDGPKQLLAHLGPVIWEAEVDGDRVDGDDKIAVRRARLTRRVEQWNERTARLFACLCAERALPIFERERPGDDRPRRAVEVAREFAEGRATAAAWDAAWAAAGDAAWDAAWDAARAAAWAAAGDAAGGAAWDAARAAAWDAVRAAAGDAAWDAARAAARDWQAARLAELLNAPGDWSGA